MEPHDFVWETNFRSLELFRVFIINPIQSHVVLLSFLEFYGFKGDNDTNATELSSQSEKCQISAEKIVETQMRITNCIWDMARPKRGEAEVKQMRSVYSYQKS